MLGKKRVCIAPRIAMLGLVSIGTWTLDAQKPAPSGPAAMVDPLIGTANGPGGGINLFPGATTPFGMVQLSPDTEDHGYGYHYAQNRDPGLQHDAHERPRLLE